MRTTINITQHAAKVRSLVSKMYGIPPEEVKNTQIQWFVQANINWWLNEGNDNKSHQLMDKIAHFEGDWHKTHKNPNEQIEKCWYDGKPMKNQVHYTTHVRIEDNGIVGDITKSILSATGVFDVKTYECTMSCEDQAQFVEFWVYATKPTKKRAIEEQLHKYGVKHIYGYNDLYETGIRRFKFTLYMPELVYNE